MARYTAEQVLEILIGLSAGGRGGGVDPGNPILGIPSFGDALAQDRRRRRRGPAAAAGGTSRRTLTIPARPKKKRKISRYQKEFGRQLKRLKKAHPRTPVTRLMKRAHAATRKALKMPRRSR